MQLNRFTDLGIRVLMYLSREPDASRTIARIADDLQVSKNHLVKVVHFMAQQHWLATTRGKNGGVCLAKPLADYRLGDLIRDLEQHSSTSAHLIECNKPPCTLLSACTLPPVLQQALTEFYAVLNRHSLADVVKTPFPATITGKMPYTPIVPEHDKESP